MAAQPLFPEVLCLGAKGKAVAVLQLLLKGVRMGPTERLQVDGDFGPTTQACVRMIEPQLYGISSEGSLGLVEALFFTRLQSISGAASLASLTSDHFMRAQTQYTGPGFEDQPKPWGVNGNQRRLAFPPWLNAGSEGRAVTLLQVFLVGAGFGIGLVFDGQYGSTTASRVGDLQRSLGLDPDGNFGQATRKAVAQAYGVDFNTLPLAPFRTNTQWCRRPEGSLRFHPHRRAVRDRIASERSRLTHQPAPVLPEPRPLAPDDVS